jgi:uncharacterized membrane protein YbhN (UPF0104 family)
LFFTLGQNNADVKIVPRQILAALNDVKTWLGALLMGGVCLANTAFVIFMPTFVKAFGYSACKFATVVQIQGPEN